MSRSKKKHGVLKDKGFAKSSYNKIFRRVNKQRIRLGKEPKLMRETADDYDVCDYKFMWSDYDEIYRKNERAYLKRKRGFFGK